MLFCLTFFTPWENLDPNKAPCLPPLFKFVQVESLDGFGLTGLFVFGVIIFLFSPGNSFLRVDLGLILDFWFLFFQGVLRSSSESYWNTEHSLFCLGVLGFSDVGVFTSGEIIVLVLRPGAGGRGWLTDVGGLCGVGWPWSDFFSCIGWILWSSVSFSVISARFFEAWSELKVETMLGLFTVVLGLPILSIQASTFVWAVFTTLLGTLLELGTSETQELGLYVAVWPSSISGMVWLTELDWPTFSILPKLSVLVGESLTRGWKILDLRWRILWNGWKG